MCDTSRSYAWRDSFIYVTNSFIGQEHPGFLDGSRVDIANVWRDSILFVTRLIYMSGMTYSYVSRDSFIGNNIQDFLIVPK